MSRKKILFLTSWYPSKVNEFAGDFVQRHARAAALLNDITVVHVYKDDTLTTNFYEEIIMDQEVKEIRIGFRNSWFAPLNYFRRWKAYQNAIMKVGEYDLVHLHVAYPAGPFALFLKKFKKKKYVITEHWTIYQDEFFKRLNPTKQFLIKKILHEAERVMPVSTDLGKDIQRITHIPSFEVVPNVVYTDLFQPAESQIKNEKKFRFVHLSSLKEDQKNVSGMLRVAKRLKDAGYKFEFHIGGNGDLKQIEDFISENDLKTTIFPLFKMNYEEVGKNLNQFDSFVLFSNFETQSCVRLESFSMGIPFIGTKIRGLSEFFPEDYGLLIERQNENELYDAMVEMIEGKKFATKESMHQFVVDHFSPEVIAQRFDRIYETVLHEK